MNCSECEICHDCFVFIERKECISTLTCSFHVRIQRMCDKSWFISLCNWNQNARGQVKGQCVSSTRDMPLNIFVKFS